MNGCVLNATSHLAASCKWNRGTTKLAGWIDHCCFAIEGEISNYGFEISRACRFIGGNGRMLAHDRNKLASAFDHLCELGRNLPGADQRLGARFSIQLNL